MGSELKNQLVDRMLEVGAYDVKIADPRKGFEYVKDPARHPLSIMPNCRSVISFVIPRSGLMDLWYVGHRRSKPQEPDFWTQQINEAQAPDWIVYRFFTLITSFIMLKAISFLHRKGYQTIERNEKENDPLTMDKLYAYEAGIGVYGKSGLILHPELGNRVGIGSILTDAKLPPDKKLFDFYPCSDCDLCVQSCPAGAFGTTGQYHNNWSAELCLSTRYKLEKRGSFCNACWQVCSYGKFDDHKLFYMQLTMNRHIRELKDWAVQELQCRAEKTHVSTPKEWRY